MINYKHLISKYLGIFIIFFLFFTSCSFSDKIQFNEDFSGSVSYEVDVAEFSKIVSEMDSGLVDAKQSTLEERIDSLDEAQAFEEYNQLEGISNFKVRGEGNDRVWISFDFEDIDALNRAYKEIDIIEKIGAEEVSDMKNEEDASGPTSNVSFKLQGNTFFYEFDKSESPNENEEASLGEIGQMIRFNTTLSFAKTIKNIETKNVEVEQNGNSVSFTYTIKEMEEPGNLFVKITFK